MMPLSLTSSSMLAVLVEVPEEAVLIVAHVGDRREDEALHAAGLHLPVIGSRCFHAIPTSSSCMQIAFSSTIGLPSWSLASPSK